MYLRFVRLTIPALGSVIYTFQPAFPLLPVTLILFRPVPSFPEIRMEQMMPISDTISVSAGSETISGEAEICSIKSLPDSKQIPLIRSDAVSWFDSPSATTPIATGIQATTNVIPANKTYYLGLNEMSGSIGPENKLQFSSGGYNYFQGNFIKFHNDVPADDCHYPIICRCRWQQ